MPACLFAALLLALPPAAASTGDGAVRLDAERSRAEFSLRAVWLMRVRGWFDSVHGDIAIDRFRNRAVVDAVIAAGSVAMASANHAEWVRSPEFFDAAAHPEIHFVSEPFPLQRLQSGGDFPGQLTLRGLTRDVRFELDPAACDRPGFDCAITAKGNLSRSAFGMHTRRGTLGDKVQLRLRIFTAAPLSHGAR
ncbi:MAG: YceI family protein [Xanthomonadales bacterium]|nr:YceI family protein [Xanthomonadales bacterium]